MAWSQEQLQNAATIYQVGRQMGMTSRDIQIGIITAMVESNLVNVNYGDRDSLGLFQQRPSQGWGSPEQVTNPVYASQKFFEALRGLGDRRWGMNMGAAAQAVQRSAFPERYAQRIADMQAIWPRIAQAAGDKQQTLDEQPYGTQDAPQAPAVPVLSAQLTDPVAAADTSAVAAAGTQAVAAGDAEVFGVQIGPHTNESFIKPLMQQSGPYAKGVDGWRKAVVELAYGALGVPYVWGGTDLSSGVDCSGLLQAVFAQAGIEIPRISYQQANSGQRVNVGTLAPGDLVAWDNSSRNNGADHIALYIGNGQILEAPRPGGVVRIRDLDGDEGAWGVKLDF